MSTAKEPRPYLNPYLAGTLLGIVLFLSFYVTGVQTQSGRRHCDLDHLLLSFGTTSPTLAAVAKLTRRFMRAL